MKNNKEIREEIQVRYKGWIEGYRHDSSSRSKKDKEENLFHVKLFAKEHIKYNYSSFIAEIISGNKFIINYPQYFYS